MTPEELREAQLAAIDTDVWNGHVQPQFAVPESYMSWHISEIALDALLEHLDHHQPPLGNALRYGLKPIAVQYSGEEFSNWDGGAHKHTGDEIKLFAINYPEQETDQ